MDQGTSGKSIVDVIDSEEVACVCGGNGDSELKGTELGAIKVSDEMPEREMVDQEACDSRGIGETLIQVDNSENMSGLADERIGETFGVVDTNENLSNSAENELVGKSEKNVKGREKSSCVIDMGKLDENWDGERVCRICHLSSEQSPKSSVVAANISMDLIQLGCGCKDELGIAHIHCAEVWFKLKGNRFCEICGETAMNVTGVGGSNSMEEWNERRLMGISSNSSNNRGCWRGQPFCNFLMACLVIAFVLPWFFRVNMF